MATTDEVREAMLDGAERAVRVIVEDLVGAGQLEAPVETGHLRGSGHAEVDRRGDRVLGRARFSTPYAAKQHEETTYQHPTGGKAKYLEDPLKARLSRYNGAIARSVEREVAKLG